MALEPSFNILIIILRTSCIVFSGQKILPQRKRFVWRDNRTWQAEAPLEELHFVSGHQTKNYPSLWMPQQGRRQRPGTIAFPETKEIQAGPFEVVSLIFYRRLCFEVCLSKSKWLHESVKVERGRVHGVRSVKEFFFLLLRLGLDPQFR